MEKMKGIKVSIEINNLSEFYLHLGRLEKLVKDINKEIEVINNFKFEISHNLKDGC